jgi:uncharacterized small protein (DUF1192 family)
MALIFSGALLASSNVKAQQVNAKSLSELDRKIGILADEIAQLKASQLKISTGKTAYGLGQAASKVYFINSGLSIGGYGEIKFTNASNEDEAGTSNSAEAETEALRNVLYFGYKYSDKWILNVEVEIEHVNKVFTEFMYVDYLANESLNYRFGLSLIPMGITNELHEPIYFNSVNRSEIEQFLIPTTWREIGAGAFGSVGSFSYKAFLFNGLDADGIAANIESGIRKGRKKGGANETPSTQNASTYALVLRSDYAFNTASSIGGSFYKGEASSLSNVDIEINIAELHGTLKKNAWVFKFLYTMIDFSNAKEWNITATNDIPNSMDGYYLEMAYDIECSKAAVLSAFIRYEAYDLTKDVHATFGSRVKSRDRDNTIIGFAYRPIDRLVFKADYTLKSRGDNTGINEFNLGMGFVY